MSTTHTPAEIVAEVNRGPGEKQALHDRLVVAVAQHRWLPKGGTCACGQWSFLQGPYAEHLRAVTAEVLDA